MHPCSSKDCRITEDQSWRFETKMIPLDPGTHFFESTLICKTIFSRSATLTSSSFAALWATRLHSISFERSDSYLFGFSLKIGITALFRYFISAQKYVIYVILRVHRANQTPLAFFRILERSWPLTSIFLIWINRNMWCLLVLKRIWVILALICSKSQNLTTCKFCFTTL